MKTNQLIYKHIFASIGFIALAAILFVSVFSQTRAASVAKAVQTGYAPVNGLKMYYEIHGQGEPLVLLHGGLSNIQLSFEKMLGSLAKTRRVIAIEQQGHGRTADIDRPLTYENMADDTAALLRYLKIEKAAFVGWSDGANTAIQIALRHPKMVLKLGLISPSFDNKETLSPETMAWLETAKPEDFGPELLAAYTKIAPNPNGYAKFIEKWIKLQLGFVALKPEVIKTIQIPTLLISGDSGGESPEHITKWFRVFLNAKLAVLPGTSHFSTTERPEWVLAILETLFEGK